MIRFFHPSIRRKAYHFEYCCVYPAVISTYKVRGRQLVKTRGKYQHISVLDGLECIVLYNETSAH
jgi:hypothetical protein